MSALGTTQREGEDRRLAADAADGRPAAIRRVLELVTRRLRTIAYNLARDGFEAQDLVQEALLKITRPEVLRRFRGDGPLEAYLVSVGARAMISAGRARATDRARSVLVEDPGVDQVGEVDVRPRDLSRSLREALTALPERARLVVLLVAVGELPYEQVAETLGMEVGTVKSSYSRARAVLRSRLEASGVAGGRR